MANNGGENMMISSNDDANGPGTTVEIKIKTLDSQTYTLRVDKCVPVPALKEQIALVTGVFSEQQRLICRGKVLNDDQLLSAYHVEDGHTLHLVVRQPVVPSSDSSSDPVADAASASGHSQGSRGPGVLVGSFNISEQDGAFPDLSRVVSALLGSLGISSARSGSEEIDLNELPTERLSNNSGVTVPRNSGIQQAGQGDTRRRTNSNYGAFARPTADPSESLQPPVIPDSISTLSVNLSRVQQEFISVAEEQNYSSQSSGLHTVDGQNINVASNMQRGLPTPAALADVMLAARQILNEQASECLLQLARQLEGQANVTDLSERARIHSNAVRSGILFQNLGTVLLELGRTTMTLRMGDTAADAVVNAGPAVFLSSAGPNPIMVQPLPYQPGTSLGAFSGGTVQPSAGISGGSVGSSVLPRNIDIRIRTVGTFLPSNVSRRDSNGSQNSTQAATAASDHGNTVQQGAGGVSGTSATRQSEVRMVPLRTVIAAVPASAGLATSEASRSAMEILYPVLARVEHVTSGNSGSSATRAPQASEHPNANATDNGNQLAPQSAAEHQNFGISGLDNSTSSVLTEMSNGQGVPIGIPSGFDRLFHAIFPGENIAGGSSSNNQDTGTNFILAPNSESSPAAGESGTAATPSDAGTFLSNLLHHIMPLINENVASLPTSSSSDAQMGGDGVRRDTTEAEENADGGGSSSRERDEPDTSCRMSPKRQKRE